jgi:hypothetical protein
MSTVRKPHCHLFPLSALSGCSIERSERDRLPRAVPTRYCRFRSVPVSVPAGRPAEFAVVTDKSLLVGAYVAENIAAGALFARRWSRRAAAARVFSTGRPPEGLRGYPLTLAGRTCPARATRRDLVLVNPGMHRDLAVANIEPLAIVMPSRPHRLYSRAGPSRLPLSTARARRRICRAPAPTPGCCCPNQRAHRARHRPRVPRAGCGQTGAGSAPDRPRHRGAASSMAPPPTRSKVGAGVPGVCSSPRSAPAARSSPTPRPVAPGLAADSASLRA